MARKKKRRVVYLKSVAEIPEFKTEQEAAEFWDTHSPIKIWDRLEAADMEIGGQLKVKQELKSGIHPQKDQATHHPAKVYLHGKGGG